MTPIVPNVRSYYTTNKLVVKFVTIGSIKNVQG